MKRSTNKDNRTASLKGMNCIKLAGFHYVGQTKLRASINRPGTSTLYSAVTTLLNASIGAKIVEIKKVNNIIVPSCEISIYNLISYNNINYSAEFLHCSQVKNSPTLPLELHLLYRISILI